MRSLAGGGQPHGAGQWLLPDVGKPLLDRMRDFPEVLGRRPGQPPPGHLLQRPDVARKMSAIQRRDWSALMREVRRPLARAEVDTQRIVAIRVDFLEDSAGELSTTPDGKFDLRSADEARVPIDPPPHNKAYFETHLKALQRYYWVQSGYSLWLEYDVFPAESDSAYHLSDTEDYGPWIISNSNPDLLALAEKLVRDAMATADTTDANLDFSRYDHFLMFHAGPDFQGDINLDTPYDIPSFNLFVADPVALEDSTFFVDLVMVVPETVSQDEFMGALNGVVAHEFGHQLGFFDVYDIYTFFPTVGMFSLMDSGDNTFGVLPDPYQNDELVFVRGALPSSLDPWHKYVFFQGDGQGPGFTFRELTTPGEVSYGAVQVSREILLLPMNLNEWYLIENRPFDLNGDETVVLRADSLTGVILGPAPPEDAPDDSLASLEYDYLLPGGGTLVWHIDWQAINDGLASPYGGINVLRDRKGVFVEEADGIPDLGDIFSPEWTGGPYDYWYEGSYTEFGPDTDPATISNHGTPSFLSMEFLTPAENTMRLRWEAGWTRTGWPVWAGGPLGRGGIVARDVTGDEDLEILAAAGSGVGAWDAGGGVVWRVLDELGAPYWSVAEGELTGQLAYAPEFQWREGGRGAMAALSADGRLHVWDFENPEPRFVWPDPVAADQDPRPGATGPVLLDSVVVVGGEDGHVRGLRPGDEPALLWRVEAGGGAIRALGAGDLDEDGREEIFWASAAGQVGVAAGPEGGPMAPAAGWPVELGGQIEVHDVLGAVHRPDRGRGGNPGGVWALDDGGRVRRWNVGMGGSREGAPQIFDFGEPPAGQLALGDVDGDQQLELVVPMASGRLEVRSLNGDLERRFPASAWGPDEEPAGRLSGPPVLLPPLENHEGLIFLPRPRGELVAVTSEGRFDWGWPQTLGYEVSGALWLGDIENDGDLEVVAGDEEGYITLIDAPRPWAELPGSWSMPGGGPDRARFVAADELPEPPGAGAFLSGPLKIYPNPVRGDEAHLDLALGAPATVRVEAIDTEGREVMQWEWKTLGAPDGVRLPMDMAELSPGFYVCRIHVEGETESYSTLKKVAVLR
ncbi:MAG: hypothetical protein GF355_00395 [Candidatus Eisenbacteria bacterium]|nr:hypothetical protein [Candidatus Eisenbacteria bacterium]